MKIVNFKGILRLSVFLLSMGLLVNCSVDKVTVDEDDTTSESDDNTDTEDDSTVTEIGENHEEAADYIWDTATEVGIVLNGTSITVNGTGATVNGTTVTITDAGNYAISGTLNDGQIIVDTDDEETVRLIFNGINVTNSSNAPINIADAEKTIIVLKENTTSYLTDGSSYVFANGQDEPNATLYSADDLTIYGDGSLVIDSNYNDAITSKDGLLIKSGTINITSVDDGIRGKDYLYIMGGTITVNAEGDGFKSDNDVDTNNGYIIIESGTINITSGGDGISAASNVQIANGDFTIKSGGGSSSYLSSDSSAKGIKADIDILIEGGIFSINSADDAIHCGEDITIETGTIALASGDDAIHSDTTIKINGGSINITKTVEGIESPNITINDGEIYIVSSDDAVNAAGNTTNYLYINGGYIVITSSGDSLDSNGNMEMTAGTVILNGPTATNNSTLDYDGTFKLNGGFLIGTGYASNMEEIGSTSSTQYSVLVKLTSAQTAGNLFRIQNSAGEDVVTFKPQKNYKSIVFSSSSLSNGSTYSIYLGGSSTGTATDGLYSGGTYTAGSLYKSFTISSKATTVN